MEEPGFEIRNPGFRISALKDSGPLPALEQYTSNGGGGGWQNCIHMHTFCIPTHKIFLQEYVRN